MLTVGTHHPYVLPEGFHKGKGTDEERSLAYLDIAFGSFWKRLNDMDVPKDTLIILTSDESPANAGLVGQNWGYLVVSTPDRARGLIRESFGQMDIALSVLDYLGLADEGSHFFGRSVFRHYDEPRWTFFSNTNLAYMGAQTPEGKMLLCQGAHRHRSKITEGELCGKYAMENDNFFSPSYTQIQAADEEFEIVREMAARTISAGRLEAPRRVFEMMTDPIFVVDPPAGSGNQMIHGGQYVDMKVGEWVEIELEVSASGEGEADTVLVHSIRSRKRGQIRGFMLPIRTGETVRLRYTFAPKGDIDTVQTRSSATRNADLPITLNFEKARMTYHRSGESPDFGIQIERQDRIATPES
jgi:hypothetical protein